MRQALFVALHDLRFMLRSKETLLWIFAMPLVFFYFIGTVTKGFGPRGSRVDRLLLHVGGEEKGFLVDALQRHLEKVGYEVLRAPGDDPPSLVLRLSEAFASSLLAGERVELQITPGSEGPRAEYDRVRISRAAYSLLADLIVLDEQSAVTGPGEGASDAFARLSAMPRQLQISVSPAGKRRIPPTGYEQTVPGTMVMFTLLVLTTSGAVLLVIERRQGLLRRLAFAPLERWQIALGKWTGKMGLGLVQIAFAMLVGATVFRVGFGPSFPMVCALLFSYAGAMASTGMLLGCLARTEGQAVAVGVISANVLGALGGCWWPIEVTPGWMQRLALFLPTGWAMDGLHKLVNFASGASSAVPHTAALLVLALALGAASARLFRFE